jgi:hypothetical protein
MSRRFDSCLGDQFDASLAQVVERLADYRLIAVQVGEEVPILLASCESRESARGRPARK